MIVVTCHFLHENNYCCKTNNKRTLAHQRKQISKLFDKIPQPENTQTSNVPRKTTWEHYSASFDALFNEMC
jgi:hypothetical protein